MTIDQSDTDYEVSSYSYRLNYILRQLLWFAMIDLHTFTFRSACILYQFFTDQRVSPDLNNMYQNSFASDQGLLFLFAIMKKLTDAKGPNTPQLY